MGIINNLKWTAISAITNSIAKLGQIVVLTRFLSKEDFGIVAIAIFIISFTDIFTDMGFSSAVLHKSKISKDEYSSLYWFNVFTSIFLYLGIRFSAPLIAEYYHNKILNDIISLIALNIIFASLSKLQRTIQQKNLKFRFIALIEMTASILMVSLSVVLAFYNFGLYSIVYSTIFYSFFISFCYLLHALVKDKSISLHFKLKETIPFVKIGIYQVGSSILDYFSSQMDIIFISSFYSMTTLGAYSLCKQLVMRVYGFVNPIITKVLTPTLALIQHDKILLKNKYIETIQILATINFPVFFIIAYSSTSLLRILYGASYGEYSLILSTISIVYAFNSVGNPLGSLLISTGRTDIGFYWTIFRIISSLVVFVIGSFYSIQILTLLFLFLTILNLYPEVQLIYKPLIDVNFNQYFKLFAKPLIICITMFPLFFIKFIILNQYLSLVCISIIFLTFYIIANYYMNGFIISKIATFLKMNIPTASSGEPVDNLFNNRPKGR